MMFGRRIVLRAHFVGEKSVGFYSVAPGVAVSQAQKRLADRVLPIARFALPVFRPPVRALWSPSS